jgi:hypothetical protein
MVYVLKMMIFHGELLNNQMVMLSLHFSRFNISISLFRVSLFRRRREMPMYKGEFQRAAKRRPIREVEHLASGFRRPCNSYGQLWPTIPSGNLT